MIIDHKPFDWMKQVKTFPQGYLWIWAYRLPHTEQEPLKMHFSIFSLWFSVQLYVLNVGWVTVRLSEWVNEITENVSGNPTFYVQGDKKFGIRFVSPSFLFRFVSFFFASAFCFLVLFAQNGKLWNALRCGKNVYLKKSKKKMRKESHGSRTSIKRTKKNY